MLFQIYLKLYLKVHLIKYSKTGLNYLIKKEKKEKK